MKATLQAVKDRLLEISLSLPPGSTPTPAALSSAQVWLTRWIEAGMPAPRLYPTADFLGITAEWSALRPWDISADFDADGALRIVFFNLNTDEERCPELPEDLPDFYRELEGEVVS